MVAPKTEFVWVFDEPPNKLAVVVCAAPNKEVFAWEVIGLLNNEVEDVAPLSNADVVGCEFSWFVPPPNTLLWPNMP